MSLPFIYRFQRRWGTNWERHYHQHRGPSTPIWGTIMTQDGQDGLQPVPGNYRDRNKDWLQTLAESFCGNWKKMETWLILSGVIKENTLMWKKRRHNRSRAVIWGEVFTDGRPDPDCRWAGAYPVATSSPPPAAGPLASDAVFRTSKRRSAGHHLGPFTLWTWLVRLLEARRVRCSS